MNGGTDTQHAGIEFKRIDLSFEYTAVMNQSMCVFGLGTGESQPASPTTNLLINAGTAELSLGCVKNEWAGSTSGGTTYYAFSVA